MSFDFKIGNPSDCGLVVKHGNKDNVVLFFDEIKEAAVYRAIIYRIHIGFPRECFLSEKEPVITKITYYIEENDYNTGNTTIVERTADNMHLDGPFGDPFFYQGKILKQVDNATISCKKYKKNDLIKAVSFGNISFSLECLKEIPFSEIKYISSLEANRNNLFVNIDFLPEGNYIVKFEAENREGKIIKESMPYYFKIDLNSNKEILDKLEIIKRCVGR